MITRNHSGSNRGNGNGNNGRGARDDGGGSPVRDIGDVLGTGALRVHHVLTLSHLLSRGAQHDYVDMTTSELGRGIKKSQQSASRHLADLERGGLVERAASTGVGDDAAASHKQGPHKTPGRRMSVRVTKRGLEAVELLSSMLQDSLAPAGKKAPRSIRLAGVLVSGMGEGAYYMALEGYTTQFRSKIGYVPFPGTLNVRMQSARYAQAVRRLRSERTGIAIERFSDGKRTYGWAKCFHAVLQAAGGAGAGSTGADDADHLGHDGNSTSAGIPCELIVLERTHHDDSIVELISDVCMRDAASMRDGSRVIVEVLPDEGAGAGSR